MTDYDPTEDLETPPPGLDDAPEGEAHYTPALDEHGNELAVDVEEDETNG